MSNLPMKECEICGGFFFPSRATQKYCHECGKHPERKKQQYSIAVAINKRHAGIEAYYEPVEQTCEQCKKMFKSMKQRRFCSEKCTKQYAIEHAACSQCGSRLLDVDISEISSSEPHFCSEKCRNEYIWSNAEKNGYIRICEHCGKKFIREKGGTFCSRQCYLAAVKSGWKPQNASGNRNDPHLPTETICCKQCGKPFTRIVGSIYDQFCSPSCRKENNRQAYLQRKEKQKQENAIKKRKAVSDEIMKKGLCWKCKTSYPDCERMSSNFQYSPEGSVFVQGKIVKCPKYVGP